MTGRIYCLYVGYNKSGMKLNDVNGKQDNWCTPVVARLKSTIKLFLFHSLKCGCTLLQFQKEEKNYKEHSMKNIYNRQWEMASSEETEQK